ncbi:hypothetical protein ACG7TL_008701 [Trametes sanguinea]
MSNLDSFVKSSTPPSTSQEVRDRRCVFVPNATPLARSLALAPSRGLLDVYSCVHSPDSHSGHPLLAFAPPAASIHHRPSAHRSRPPLSSCTPPSHVACYAHCDERELLVVDPVPLPFSTPSALNRPWTTSSRPLPHTPSAVVYMQRIPPTPAPPRPAPPRPAQA